MNQEPLNILLAEDNQDDCELINKSLIKLDQPLHIDQIVSGDECLEQLSKKEYHLLLLDYKIQGGDGLSVIKEIRKRGSDLPIIVITGMGDERVAAETIKLGAQDYIVKAGNFLKIIPFVITDVLEKHRLIKEKQVIENKLSFERKKLQLIFDNMGDSVCMIDNQDKILLFNKQFERLFRKIPPGPRCFEVITGANEPCPDCLKRRDEIAVGQSTHFEIVTKDKRTLMVTFTPFLDLKGNRVFLEVFKDITKRKDLEEKLYIESITDSLTGLFNQRYFYSLLKKEMIRSKRSKRSLSLILFDLDGFKAYNDEYGHQGGDKVLKTIGKVVKKEIRTEVDIPFRYGGDEFTIILPEATLNQAINIAERIRESFADYKLTTLSTGVVELQEDMDIKAFIKMADLRMYEAKKSGGNCVVER